MSHFDSLGKSQPNQTHRVVFFRGFMVSFIWYFLTEPNQTQLTNSCNQPNQTHKSCIFVDLCGFVFGSLFFNPTHKQLQFPTQPNPVDGLNPRVKLSVDLRSTVSAAVVQRSTFRRLSCVWRTSPRRSRRTGSRWRHNWACRRRTWTRSGPISTRTWNGRWWCCTSGCSRAGGRRPATTSRTHWASSAEPTSSAAVCTTSRRSPTSARRRSPRDTSTKVPLAVCRSSDINAIVVLWLS